MDQFFELSYDTQWTFLFFHSKKKLVFRQIPHPDSESPVQIWDFEPYFANFCEATKRDMTIKNYDEKMVQMSDAIDYLIANRLLTQTFDQATNSFLIQITPRGENYFELEIENGIRKVLPIIDFPETFDNELRNKLDADGNHVFTHDIDNSGFLGNFRNLLTSGSGMKSLSGLIFDYSVLTKNLIEFVVFLITYSPSG